MHSCNRPPRHCPSNRTGGFAHANGALATTREIHCCGPLLPHQPTKARPHAACRGAKMAEWLATGQPSRAPRPTRSQWPRGTSSASASVPGVRCALIIRVAGRPIVTALPAANKTALRHGLQRGPSSGAQAAAQGVRRPVCRAHTLVGVPASLTRHAYLAASQCVLCGLSAVQSLAQLIKPSHRLSAAFTPALMFTAKC